MVNNPFTAWTQEVYYEGQNYKTLIDQAVPEAYTWTFQLHEPVSSLFMEVSLESIALTESKKKCQVQFEHAEFPSSKAKYCLLERFNLHYNPSSHIN